MNVPRFYVPILFAMQWSVACRSALYNGREHLWIMFSFKPALHSDTNRIQLVVCSKISPCVIHYYLYQMTLRSRIWLFFGIERDPIPNYKSHSLYLCWPIKHVLIIKQAIEYTHKQGFFIFVICKCNVVILLSEIGPFIVSKFYVLSKVNKI